MQLYAAIDRKVPGYEGQGVTIDLEEYSGRAVCIHNAVGELTGRYNQGVKTVVFDDRIGSGMNELTFYIDRILIIGEFQKAVIPGRVDYCGDYTPLCGHDLPFAGEG